MGPVQTHMGRLKMELGQLKKKNSDTVNLRLSPDWLLSSKLGNVYTVTPRYNVVVGVHDVGPRCK